MIPETVAEKLQEIAYLITDQEIDIESVDPQTTVLRGDIHFINGSILHFMEYTAPETHDYRFHYMDGDENLIRRWDSAPHHQGLENFPFHVHTPEGTESSREMTFDKILEKVEDLILEEIEE